jgi:hypothetical protein
MTQLLEVRASHVLLEDNLKKFKKKKKKKTKESNHPNFSPKEKTKENEYSISYAICDWSSWKVVVFVVGPRGDGMSVAFHVTGSNNYAWRI